MTDTAIASNGASNSTPVRQFAEVDSKALAVHATLFSKLADMAGQLRDQAREEFKLRMDRGEKITAHDPNDPLLTLGTVSYSNPAVEAYITDQSAFDAFCRLRHPDGVESWIEFGDHDKVAAVLAEHAPELLILHQSVKASTREEVLKAARVQDIPGTARKLPRSALTVRPTTNAQDAVMRLIRGVPGLSQVEAPKPPKK